MRTLAPALLLVLYSALTADTPGRATQGAAATGDTWKAFLRDQVTPRFPQGLTVWEANGQWQQQGGRISRERAKVLLLVHDETQATHAKLLEVVEAYKKAFQQESVLWESARVCAMF
jgi:hypothetical protein